MWDPGLVVLCFWENIITFLGGKVFTSSTVRICKTWALSPVTKAKSMHVLRVRSFSDRGFASSSWSRYIDTISTFHVSSYLGWADLSSETPLINLHTLGRLPTVWLETCGTGADSTLLAEFTALKLVPRANRNAIKFPTDTGCGWPRSRWLSAVKV